MTNAWLRSRVDPVQFEQMTNWTLNVIPRNKNPDQIFFLFYYIRIFLRIYTRTYPSTKIRSSYTHFETQTISYLDSVSWAGIMTVSARLITDHHESGLARVVCIS